MKIAKLILLAFSIGILSGCGPIMRQLTQLSEEEAFRYDKKYLAEHEEWMKTNQEAMALIEKWIQPANKKEECKIFVETRREDDRTLHPDHKVYWDGQCKDDMLMA